MRRTEQEEYRSQLVYIAAELDAGAVRRLAHAECTRTIGAQLTSYEPRERPAKSGMLRAN